MKRSCFSLFILFLAASFFSIAGAQSTRGLVPDSMTSGDLALLDQAESFIQDDYHLMALPIYESLSQKYPNDPFFNYRLGICYLYRSDFPEKSLELIKKAGVLQEKLFDYPFFFGRALHLNYLFKDAIVQFEKYLAKKPSNKDAEQTQVYIDQCNIAREQIALPADVKIKNLGKDVNTTWSEYVPVISSDEAMLIFTYRGVRSTGGLQSVYTDSKEPTEDSFMQYYEDIFYSYKIGSHWLIPDPIGENINTNYHDAAVAVSNDGQKLFLFKSTPKDKGDIYLSLLDGNLWGAPVSLGRNINSNYWEGSCSLSSDEKTLYFSSERPGGFGGKDIWVSHLQEDGEWGRAENLGPVINTKYDEDAPFIHPDGKMLHFSSNGPKSMGGYDVFRSYLNDDGAWSKCQNIGYPVNTVDDDIYYVITADGTKGYYSSGRPGGYGIQDIYEVKPGVAGRRNALVSIKGSIMLDDLPVKAHIRVVNSDTDEEVGKFNSNSKTGKYLLNLPTGSAYKIIYSADGVNEDQIKTFNSKNVDYYLEASIDVFFYTNEVLAKRAKNKLTILNKDGSIFKTATQMRDGRFIFNYLPADEKVLFRLEGEDVEFMNKVLISVSGIQKSLMRGRDRYFRFDYLYPEYNLLSALPTETDSLLDPELMTYQQIVDKFGGYKAEGMSFTVQVGAYFEAHNFNYSHLMSVGKIETRTYQDGISRFTIGTFDSLEEAEEMRKRIVARGGETTDAFVLAVYNGERVLMRDLAGKNFYNK